MRFSFLLAMVALMVAQTSLAAESDESTELSTPSETSESQNCMAVCLKDDNDFYDCQESCIEIVSQDWTTTLKLN